MENIKHVLSYEEWLNDLVNKINNAYEKSKTEYYNFLEKKLTDNYNKIISQFYSSYNPRYYQRNVNNNLYKLICFEIDDNGFAVGFDPSKIKGRNGYDGLYDTVFLKGYHGGAYMETKGAYMVPWTYPYKAYNGISDSGKYKPFSDGIEYHWEYAVRTEAPYTMWESFINTYNKGQYQKDFDLIFNKNVEKYL